MRKNKLKLVQRWLEKARRDLLTSQRSLQAKEAFTDVVCFHAQQAAEKYLKVYLIWKELNFPKTHALEDLALLAAQSDPDFLELKDNVATLTPHAVEARYPEFDEPTLTDAREAVTLAKRVKEVVIKRLPEQVMGKERA